MARRTAGTADTWLDRAGAIANPELDGIVGGEILRRFTLTLDYPHKRMLFTPNTLSREPFESHMAGAGFKAASLKFDRIVVRYVIPTPPPPRPACRKGTRS